MSKGLTAENLLRVFPSALASSKNLYALASAIADELETLFSENRLLAIYANISSLPEELLDILAKDYKVDWYLPDTSLEAKREQIAAQFMVHRHLGTKSAIVFALSAICPGSDVQEWFEYGGDPYYFKIVCDVTEQTTPISQSDLVRVARAVKPTRAVLEDQNVIYRSRNVIAVSVNGGYVFFNPRLCGTYPKQAMQGEDENGFISLESVGSSTEYSVRMCGTPLGSIV
ncbi:MAG: phage tail protein I [Clostridia bacterium]|nr:phage tail protein I [Clostridia bacterium]MBR0303040.1 phage tail protein I [Clostridia bacterium]